MKDWFKYKYGFVNIDSENLYFTNTGNWSEVKDLKEKGIQKQDSFRQFRMRFIPFILVGIAVVLAFFMLFKVDPTIKYTVVGSVLVLALTSYTYLKTEIGEKFKLPISKIETIDIRGETATVTFQDGNENVSVYMLEKLDRKGMNLLEEVVNQLSKNKA
ncbi:hypothetical protein KORDIASMS9_01164 [Kordia sp. SMS9]|uniref:hypothetical protein n=1 Tax=Kordia sp. SMS9 TaxID=2282170 RepID=UPI000E0D1BC2|nr:hypothetical protein [Kordia sp. SMS9]AXG68945.1 hypothetical protein KORDIASMS9_01164 [Kordia sp. SMS9]